MQEEAIEEELWQAVMNLAAGEEHIMETLLKVIGAYQEQKVDDEELKKYLIELDILRDTRKQIVKKIMEVRGISDDTIETTFRSYKGEVWCLIKHCLLTKMHLFETGQKYLTLFSKTEDEKWLQRAAECFQLARRINAIFLDSVESLFPQT